MPTYNKDKEAIARLNREQFRVTQQNATERPFQNTFWDHDEPGIYVTSSPANPCFHLSISLRAVAGGRVSQNPWNPRMLRRDRIPATA